MRIWLDDIRVAPEGWTHVKTIEDAKALMQTEKVTHISLDHDLGGEAHEDAYYFCLWMAEHDIWPSEWIGIHSANPVGRENMRAVINRYSPFMLR